MAVYAPRAMVVALISLFLALGAPASAGEMPPRDTVLIADDEHTVTVADVEAAMAVLPPEQQARVKGTERLLHRILDRIFINRVLAHEAADGAIVHPTGMDFEQAAAFTDDEELIARIAQQEIESRLQAERLEEIAAGVDEGPARRLARERYQANRADHVLPERVSARHILIRGDGEDPEAAREKAQGLLESLREDPEAFEEMAREHSDDPGSAVRGGDLGEFTRGRMVPEFEDAAFDLAPEGLSEVVETQFGFHIIQVYDHTPEYQQSFEEVEERLVSRAMSDRRAKARAEHVRLLREREQSAVNWDAIEALEAAWGTESQDD